jgi:transcription elongation factor GreA-like protein
LKLLEENIGKSLENIVIDNIIQTRTLSSPKNWKMALNQIKMFLHREEKNYQNKRGTPQSRRKALRAVHQIKDFYP